MKKGFTLIELLAVIAILSIILLIALPKVLNVINNSKLEAFKKNEEMMIKATRIYLAANQDLLPSPNNKIEVSLTTLQTNNYIKDIKDPIDNSNCSGYVVISNLDDKTIYTPHLKCESSVINSSSDEALKIHYSFNNYSEPTYNLISATTLEGHGSSFVLSSDTYNGSNYYTNTVTTPSVGNNFGFRKGGANVLLDQSGPKHITLSFDARIKVSPGALTGYVRVRYTDLTEESHYWSYTPSTWFGSSNLNEWIKVVGKVTLNQSKTPDVITAMYVYRDNAAVGIMDVANIQLEQKNYDTPYTPNIRISTIKDLSLNNFNATLDRLTTPIWNHGSYYFDGVNNVISMPNNIVTTADARLNGLTYSVYVKPTTINNSRIFGTQISNGYSDYSNGGLGITGTGKAQMIAYSDSSPAAYVYSIGTSTLEANKWYHIVGVYNNTTNTIQVYLNGKKEGNAETIGVFSRIDNTISNRIGLKDNVTKYPYNGYISDVRIYNRAMSEEEISKLYYSIKQ